jgi:hypothetical protein
VTNYFVKPEGRTGILGSKRRLYCAKSPLRTKKK